MGNMPAKNNPLPAGRRGVSVSLRCSSTLQFDAEAGTILALVCNDRPRRDIFRDQLLMPYFQRVSFDGTAEKNIDHDGMQREWGSEFPVALLTFDQRGRPVDYSTTLEVQGITTAAEELVCSVVGVASAVLRNVTAVHVGDPANWRAALARLLLTSKPARHGVLIVEESPHTRDIIDVLLALRPWIQPTVIVLSADATACTKANRRLYASLVKELEEYQVVPLNGAITAMLADIPRDGFFSSTRCPCGGSLAAKKAVLRRCARCNNGALGGWRCTACPYAVCIRCLDSERFVEARVAEGRDDSYTLAMSVPAAVQLMVPDVVGLVLRFACATVCQAHTAGSVCRSWRKGLLTDEELWAVFFARRWPRRRMPRRATSTLYRARVLAELRAVGRESLAEHRAAVTAAALTFGSDATAPSSSAAADDAKPSSLFTPIEECDFAFKCPIIFSALRPLQPELGIHGEPAEVRFCDVCTKKVYEVRSQEELEHHRSLGNCVSFTRGSTASWARLEGRTRYVIYGDAADGGQAAIRLLRQITAALEGISTKLGVETGREDRQHLEVKWNDGAVELTSRLYGEVFSALIHVVLGRPSTRASRTVELLLHVDNTGREETAAIHAKAIMDNLRGSLLQRALRDSYAGAVRCDPEPTRVIPLVPAPWMCPWPRSRVGGR
jgi:hypothetical protein